MGLISLGRQPLAYNDSTISSKDNNARHRVALTCERIFLHHGTRLGDQAAAEAVRDGLRAIDDTQLAEQSPAMSFDGVLSQEQLPTYAR